VSVVHETLETKENMSWGGSQGRSVETALASSKARGHSRRWMPFPVSVYV
jgi:hypothetical protein